MWVYKYNMKESLRVIYIIWVLSVVYLSNIRFSKAFEPWWENNSKLEIQIALVLRIGDIPRHLQREKISPFGAPLFQHWNTPHASLSVSVESMAVFGCFRRSETRGMETRRDNYWSSNAKISSCYSALEKGEMLISPTGPARSLEICAYTLPGVGDSPAAVCWLFLECPHAIGCWIFRDKLPFSWIV